MTWQRTVSGQVQSTSSHAVNGTKISLGLVKLWALGFFESLPQFSEIINCYLNHFLKTKGIWSRHLLWGCKNGKVRTAQHMDTRQQGTFHPFTASQIYVASIISPKITTALLLLLQHNICFQTPLIWACSDYQSILWDHLSYILISLADLRKRHPLQQYQEFCHFLGSIQEQMDSIGLWTRASETSPTTKSCGVITLDRNSTEIPKR